MCNYGVKLHFDAILRLKFIKPVLFSLGSPITTIQRVRFEMLLRFLRNQTYGIVYSCKI